MPAEEVKPKPVPYKKIEELGPDGQPTRWYVELRRLIAAYHPGLVEFKIGLLWRYGWSPDKDNLLTLGQAVRASPDAHQFHGYHGYIRLNYEYYHDPSTEDLHKIAVLDHEACHFDREVDKNGDTRKDEQGEPCIRMVKHDIEEFECIIERYGLYTDRLRRIAAAIYRTREVQRQQPANARQTPAATIPIRPNNNEEGLYAADAEDQQEA